MPQFTCSFVPDSSFFCTVSFVRLGVPISSPFVHSVYLFHLFCSPSRRRGILCARRGGTAPTTSGATRRSCSPDPGSPSCTTSSATPRQRPSSHWRAHRYVCVCMCVRERDPGSPSCSTSSVTPRHRPSSHWCDHRYVCVRERERERETLDRHLAQHRQRRRGTDPHLTGAITGVCVCERERETLDRHLAQHRQRPRGTDPHLTGVPTGVCVCILEWAEYLLNCCVWGG